MTSFAMGAAQPEQARVRPRALEIAAQVLPGADPLMLVTQWTGMPPGALRRRW